VNPHDAEALANQRYAEIVRVVDDANRWRTWTWTRLPGWARLPSAVALVVASTSAVALFEYQSMRQQRITLQRANFLTAVNTAQELLGVLREALDHGDTLTVAAGRIQGVAVNIIRRVRTVETSDTVELMAQLGWTISDVNIVLGNQRDGYDSAKSVRDQVEPLYKKDPKNINLLDIFFKSSWRMGDAVAAIDSQATTQDEALKLYQDAERFARSIAEIDPDNNERQRDIAFTLPKIGDVYRILGNSSAAISTYSAAVDSVRSIAEKEPRNKDWKRELANVRSRLGDALADKGDLESVRGYLRTRLRSGPN
jgi:tetratricopeptide (TPR) repeat protein